MKFEKFVKQLGGSGVIHTRSDGSRWLTSCTASIRIPDDMEGVIAEHITDMPDRIDTIIRKERTGGQAQLIKAIMPSGDSSIKDCLRVYAAASDSKLRLAISNDDWSLIDIRHDVVEILAEYDFETEKLRPTALLVKEYINLEDTQLVGVIFPNPNATNNI